MGKKCIVIGASLNIAPARIALINSDVNDGDFIILVGNSSDALNALAEFTRHVYQDLNVEVKPITVNTQVSLVDSASMLGSIIEGNAPCDVVIGIAGDRWLTTVLSFLAMTLATVSGFTNISVDRIFVMPGDKGEPVDWPTVPRLIDLSLVEFRVLRLICSGYGLAKEIVKGYTSKYGEAISLQAIERILAKLRVKGLVNGKHSGRALVYEETELDRLVACS